MGAQVEIVCKCGCGRKKMVRVSDKKRGWGIFYSKSCKAKWQERRTGQYRAYTKGLGVSHAAKLRGDDPNKVMTAHYKKDKVRTFDGVEVASDYRDTTDQEWDAINSEAEMGWDAHKNTW